MKASDEKIGFARTLADTISLSMTECERYGMCYGCDTGCPVLNDGNCEFQETENKHLWEEIKGENLE